MKSSKVSQVMKWVGYGTAVLSLAAGIGGIGKAVLDRLEARRKIDALVSSESVQLKGQDYWSAWRSLEQASQVDPDSARVHAAQEALAMEWLEKSTCWRTKNFRTSQKGWSPC
jgi:predicted kinase